MTTKILLDTDIGSDIDDAVCLAYLLAQPACELLGITTVTGEGARRAALASALCTVAGKDVPIYIGAEQPLLVSQQQPEAPQAAALERWPHATDFPAGEAIEFMRHTIRAHPGEVILLTIGPLTNAALLFATDPEIPALLKGLVMMCGVFSLPGRQVKAEWNAKLDPHATAMVYRTPVTMHRSVGLDVTLQVQLPADEVHARFDAPLLEPVRDFAAYWFEHTEQLTFHDPLAAVTLFDETVCAFEPGTVDVGLRRRNLGRTTWHSGSDGPHQIAVGVDAGRFYQRFFEVFE